MRLLRPAWAFAALTFITAAASALAAPNQPMRPPMPIETIAPVVRPVATANASSLAQSFLQNVMPGQHVPLSLLPKLPRQTVLNTITPQMVKNHVHPMAAGGATINITGTNCGGGGALGDQFNIGCALSWKSLNMPNGDTKQDYYILPTTGDELNTTVTAQSCNTPGVGTATAQGATYTGTTGANNNTTLTCAGTYVFGTYDKTTAQWIAVIYVNAGQVFNVQVYADSFHTQQQYQFDAAASNTAYIYLPNVSASDYYVVGIAQTSVSPNCVFIAPAPLPSPYTYPAHQLCNLTASTGVQAPNGDLSVAWPLSSAYIAGTYSVEVYDITQGVRLGQVQVSLTGSGGTVIATSEDASGANANPSPNPVNGDVSSTIVDWDGGPGAPQDESVTGIKASATGIFNGANYLWTLSDPQGQVVSSVAGTAAGNTSSNVFTFDSLTGGVNQVLPPGQYPAKSWTVQLYNTVSKTVIASQAVQVLAYSTQTQFNNSGTLGSALAIRPGLSAVAGLQITNVGNNIFNQFGDSLAKIVVSTGPDFNMSSTTGNGIMASTVNGALAPCNTVCTTTATDSNGNTWNVTVTCSAVTADGECNIEFDEASTASPLVATNAPYITLSNITFFYETGAKCGNTCQGVTSELPSHGLQWSSLGGTSAWTPIYFTNQGAGESGTVAFSFAGSENTSGGCKQNRLAQNGNGSFTAPMVGTHFFEDYFLQGDYSAQSPYYLALASGCPGGNFDIYTYYIKDTGAQKITAVAIQLPSLLLFQGFWGVDAGGGGAWTQNPFAGGSNGCPANFSPGWICLGGAIAAGASGTVWIDEAPSLQSFPFQDTQVQAYTNNNEWFSLTPATTGISPVAGANVDSLGVGLYSLIGADMTTAFSPSTVGTGTTATTGVTMTNTSTAVDANPDYVDAIVLEAPNQTVTINNTPTLNTGWSMLSPAAGFDLSGTTRQFWFGLCAAQYTNGAKAGASYGGPPAATGGNGTPLTAPYPSLGTCAATEPDALAPGQTLTISNMQLANFGAAGTQKWKMYAHGANGGGWSAAQPFTLNVTAESVSVWFNQINGTTVATNTIPTIGSSPNTYQYAIKNTSSASSIGTVVITIPGTDINNENAYDGTTNWDVTNITTGGVTLSFPAGQTDGNGGCSVNTSGASTYNPTPQSAGTNGQITISGCTTFKPGDTLYVNFAAANPSSNSDSYVWPATVDGSNAGVAWLQSDVINEQFTLGLSVTVDPAAPGPGGSEPILSCGTGTCAFSGSTADFGNINDGVTDTFKDIVRTSVFYSGATDAGHNLDVYVSAANNPTNSSGSPTNELLTETDSSTSTTGQGITFNAGATCTAGNVMTGTYCVVSSSNMLVAAIPEQKSTYTGCGSSTCPYDIIDDFEVAMGASDPIQPTAVTVTYTVIAE